MSILIMIRIFIRFTLFPFILERGKLQQEKEGTTIWC